MQKEQFMASVREAAQAPDSTAETPPAQPPVADSQQAPETEPHGEPAVPKKASDVPEAEAETPPEPKGIKDALAKAGVDIKDLYEYKIPGTEITFGQAKDAAPDIADVSRLRLDLEAQSDKLVSQHTKEREEMGAVLQRLSNQFGREAVMKVVGEAPTDVAAAQAAVDAELLRWKPELTEPGALNEFEERIAKAASVYGLAPYMKGANVGLKRAFDRLAKLESYLDKLRIPEQPPKKVGQATSNRPPTSGKRKRIKRSGDRNKDKWKQALLDAQQG